MKAWNRIGLLLTLLLATAGCVNVEVHRIAPDREMSEAEFARLLVPAEIDLKEFDGGEWKPARRMRPVKHTVIEIAPGPHTLKARYYVPTTDTETIDRSNWIDLEFEADAGASYRLAFRLEGRDNARAWRLWIEKKPDEEGNAADASQEVVSREVSPEQAKRTIARAATLSPADAKDDATPLDRLKAWWEAATDAERNEFMKWIIRRP